MQASETSSEAKHEKSIDVQVDVKQLDVATPDVEFGGCEARRKLERKLLRKLDIRMSLLMVIYVLNYVDRNNAAAARLRGFEHDLHLQGQQFATLLSILYVGYTLVQIPSNMLLNHIGKPSWYIAGCMMAWGVLSILTGVTKNFTGALFARFFLGFVEAAFFPGALFLLSKWYKRDELGARTAVLYNGLIISTAFGALMASGILDTMDGKLGRAAWRWLFFIEGSLTIFIAACAMYILPDYPGTTTWLSEDERRLAMKRMEEDAGVGDERETGVESHTTGLKMALQDWSVWCLGIASTSQNTALSFNAYFPTLCATMGFNPTVTLLLCAPPFIYASIMSLVISRHSDKTGERFFHICTPIFGGIIGFIISLSTMNIAARYFSLFLMAQSYSGYLILYPWISNSFPRPPSKRAVALAFINAFSQIGNISGSYVFQSKWGPTYRKSYAVCIAAASCTICLCYVFRMHLARLNKKLDEEEKAKEIKVKGYRYLL